MVHGVVDSASVVDAGDEEVDGLQIHGLVTLGEESTDETVSELEVVFIVPIKLLEPPSLRHG
jgi:hypothetical protein